MSNYKFIIGNAISLRLKILNLLIIFTTFLGIMSQTYASSLPSSSDCANATLAQYSEATGLLCLPVVEVTGDKGLQYYKAQLGLESNTNQFSLLSLEPITASGTNNPSFTVATGILKIPEVTFYGKNGNIYNHYTAALKLLFNSNPATFSIVSAGTDISPNLYTLSGNNISVRYSTSSFDGKPQFDYQDQQKILHFTGEQILREETTVGTLITVIIVMTVDTGRTVFSILLPRVNLQEAGGSLPIETFGITTEFKLSFLRRFGQGDFYSITPMTGKAEQVFF